MMGIGDWEIAVRLFLSAILGGLIGLERESHGRPAGLRTHILVCLGSCLVMMISIYGFRFGKGDPARLAAQVVSGIGFLGAGTILREGASVKGLTTAASLWVVAGIGLAMGGGFYFAGLIVTIFSVLTLLLLEPVEKRLFTMRTFHLLVILDNTENSVVFFNTIYAISGWKIKHMELENDEPNTETSVDLIIEARDLNKEKILAELLKVNGIKKVIWK